MGEGFRVATLDSPTTALRLRGQSQVGDVLPPSALYERTHAHALARARTAYHVLGDALEPAPSVPVAAEYEPRRRLRSRPRAGCPHTHGPEPLPNVLACRNDPCRIPLSAFKTCPLSHPAARSLEGFGWQPQSWRAHASRARAARIRDTPSDYWRPYTTPLASSRLCCVSTRDLSHCAQQAICC